MLHIRTNLTFIQNFIFYILNNWWPGMESNHRHADLQSAALPTELPGQFKIEL